MSDTLEKDVGRITFDKIAPEMTRPDQQVKTHVGRTTPEVFAASVAQKIKNFDPSISDWNLELYKRSIREVAKKRGNQGHTIKATKQGRLANLGAQVGQGSDNFVKEHEGFLYLVNHVSGKFGIPDKDVYEKMNSHIPNDVKKHLKLALGKHRGYQEDATRSELIPALRDALVNKEWRDKVLENVPVEQHQSFTTKMKIAFRNMRNAASNMSHGDLLHAEQKAFDKKLKKGVPINGLTVKILGKSGENMSTEQKTQQKPEDADKAEEKRLRKIIESGIEVLKHKLGRIPDLAEVQSILEQGEVKDQTVSEAMAEASNPKEQKSEPMAKTQDSEQTTQSADAQSAEMLPRIFRLKVLYGMSGDDQAKKPDPTKILFYHDPESGHTFDCDSGVWHDSPLSITQHLNSRPITYSEADIVSAIANGVMDDQDYQALEKANLLMDNPKKIWKLRKDAEQKLLELEKSEKMEKALPSDQDQELSEDDVVSHEDGDVDMDDGLPALDDAYLSMNDGYTKDQGEPDEEMLAGENILEQILDAAMSKVDHKLEDLVRRIVREELGLEGQDGQSDQISEQNPEDGLEWSEIKDEEFE